MIERVIPKPHEIYHEEHGDKSSKRQLSTYYPISNDLPTLRGLQVWPIDQRIFMNFQFKRTFISHLFQFIPQQDINYHAYDGYDQELLKKFKLYVHSYW